MRTFVVAAIVAFFLFGIYGCSETEDERQRDRVAEEVARDIERDLDRELERAEEELERVRDRIEDEFDKDHVTDEDIERIQRDVEESISTGLARVGKVLEEIGNKIQEDADVDVTDFREFRDVLPSELMDMQRVDWDGANKSALGMRFSKLEARYENNQTEMDIAILDLGTMKGLAAMGFDFIDREIDEENRDGFKRTREFEGFPGYEAVEYHDNHTEMQGVVIINERFVVAAEIEGRELSKRFLNQLFDELNLRKLARME